MWPIALASQPKLAIQIRDDGFALQTGVLVGALLWQNAQAGTVIAAGGTLTEGLANATGSYSYLPTALETGTLGLCSLYHPTLAVVGGQVQVGPVVANAIQINSSASAASALSLITNDTNNTLCVNVTRVASLTQTQGNIGSLQVAATHFEDMITQTGGHSVFLLRGFSDNVVPANAAAAWGYLAANATVSASMGAAVLALSGNAGGVFTVVLPVVDASTVALQGVRTGLTINGINYPATTDTNGHATYANMIAGTAVVSLYYPGYSYGGGTVTIAGSGTVTAQVMTLNISPTPTPGAFQCTGGLTFIDKHGAPLAGETLTIEADPDFAYTATGSGFSGLPIISDASDANGAIAVLVPSGSLPMRARNRHGRWIKFTTAANNGETFGLPSVLGQV